MLLEMTEIIGLPVYTQNAILVGNINNVIVNVEESKIESLFVATTNPLLVDESKPIAIPFRWVQSIGDVVLLKYFPKRVSVKKSTPPQEQPKQE